MQQTIKEFDDDGNVKDSLWEVFQGKSEKELIEAMDVVLEKLKKKGHVLGQRVKVGRNDFCPCGSGKKFKKCHGDLSKSVSENTLPKKEVI